MSEPLRTTAIESSPVHLFGLAIRSALPLPPTWPLATATAPDVEIVYGAVPEQLSGAEVSGLRYQARPGELLLKVDGVARYWVRDGRKIIIEPTAGASDDDVLVFLLGSALGALLHQRSALVLHGSAVTANGAAIGFLGPSGIGKSTLATAFSRRGLSMLTDDLCVLWPDDASGLFALHPGPPQAKLWEDSLQHMGIPSGELPRIRNKLNKRALPLAAAAALSPAPLQHVYVLVAANVPAPALQPLHGPQKFNELKGQTYRWRFLEGLGLKAQHFEHVLRLAKQANVTLALRPKEGFQLDALTELIANDLEP